MPLKVLEVGKFLMLRKLWRLWIIIQMPFLLVANIFEYLESKKKPVILDVGSNIGAYTIPVAAMNRRVIAVDMMKDNLDIIKKSLHMENLTRYVNLENSVLRYVKCVEW